MMKKFVYFIVMVSFLDMFSQLPIMTPLAYQLGATPILAGVIVGMYSGSNMIGNVIAGDFIDKVGIKKVIIYSIGFTGFIILLYTISQNAYHLLFIRFAHGFSAGFIVPAAFTYLGNEANEGEQGKTMAKSGAAIGISAIIGPAFSSIMNRFFSLEWIFFIISGLMILCMLIAITILPNHRKQEITHHENAKIKLKELFFLLKNKHLFNAYLGSFSLMFTLGILSYLLPLKVESLNFSNSLTGLLLSTFGIAAILFFLLPTNRLFDRYDHQKGMVLGMSIISIALVFLSLFTMKSMLFIAMCVYGIGFALLFPSTSAIIIEHSNSNDRGKAFGLFYAFFSLGVVIGSFTVGAIAATPSFGFLLGSIGILAMILIILYRIKGLRIHLQKNH